MDNFDAVALRGASLCGSRGYEGEEDDGAVSIETISSYGTRFVVCDLRACHLRDYCILRHSLCCLRPSGVLFIGGTPFALRLDALR